MFKVRADPTFRIRCLICLQIALNDFGARYKMPPGRIFFFRDGVSEGELDQVSKMEIKAIKGILYNLRCLGFLADIFVVPQTPLTRFGFCVMSSHLNLA
jgi:hypothetical protein